MKTGRTSTGRETLRDWEKRFRSVGANLPGPETMAAVGAHVVSATLERMERAVTPEGRPHKPLSEEWVRRKVYGTSSEGRAAKVQRRYDRAEARGKPVKRRRGYKSRGGYSPKIWQYTGESKRKVQVLRASAKGVVVVINTPYSGYANDERPVLGLSREDRLAIDRIFNRALGRALTGDGYREAAGE